MTIPWLPFFIAAIIRWLLDIFHYRDTETLRNKMGLEVKQLRLFAIAWLVVPLLFFSFSSSKLPGYILPSVLPAIVITGMFLERLITKNEVWRFPVQVFALGMLLIVYIAISFALPSYADQESVKSLIAAADLRGFSESKVMGYQSVSHNAEFYASGRLLGGPDGKQQRVPDIPSVNTITSQVGPVLLLVRPNKLEEVVSNEAIKAEVLAFNGKLYIVAVSPQ